MPGARIVFTETSSAMKHLVLTTALLTLIPAVISAQTQSRQRLSSEANNSRESNPGRTRVVGPRVANHVEQQKARPSSTANSTARTETETPKPVWGNTTIVVRPQPNTQTIAAANNSTIAPKNLPPARVVAPPPVTTPSNPTIIAVPARTSAPTYVVGIGDVLDIRLANMPVRDSTLFTVFKNGAIEYPLLDRPLVVAGLTTDEIARVLTAQIKVITTPRVNVSIRDYASHAILISGLVDSPGKKTLRREVMPLFAVLAEASVRPEATTVTVIHNGKAGPTISLANQQAMSATVSSGDVIRVSADRTANQFVYVGGEVASPGEKSFREGMTLTQVLLTAGAKPAVLKTVKISRRNRDGLLTTSEYDLRSIEKGKTPDPLVAAGDRIEATR